MSAHAAVDIRFLDLAEGTLVERHNPPSLQYVIVLSSQIELGLREGVTQRLSPGDVLLSGDTTGRGHTTRVVGKGKAILAVIPLCRPLTP